tara:strand:+ start:46 stop:1125 length:1080 start_codon:yes stop_codon:yes gene_type:complete
MKKILILCPYPEGVAAGQRLKYEQYLESWKEKGFSVEISSFFDIHTWHILYEKKNFLKKILGTMKGYFRRIRDLLIINKYDLIYISMWVTPLGFTLFEKIVRRLNSKVIYDFDDAIFLDSKTTESFNSSILRGSSKSKYLIKYSNHVILSSPYHLDYCRERNIFHSATYIPCSLDLGRFVLKNINHQPDKKIVLGWTGTFSAIPFLDSIKEMLIELNKTEDFKLLLITNFDYFIPGIDLEVRRWNKKTEIGDLHDIDIGLYPIPMDSWGLGKGGLKALQYMSIGIPAVATDFGTTKNIIKNGETGFLVKHNNEWKEALKLLINDPHLRNKIGKEGRKIVEETYSVEINKYKYLDILQSI